MIDIYKTISLVAPTNATSSSKAKPGPARRWWAHDPNNSSRQTSRSCRWTVPPSRRASGKRAVRALKALTPAPTATASRIRSRFERHRLLDEIGDLEQNLQLKLLRFLQEKEIRPLGACAAASGCACDRSHQQGSEEDGRRRQVREDLWYRINVSASFCASGGPRGDVPLLAHYFLKKYNERYHQQAKLTQSALTLCRTIAGPATCASSST